SLDLDVENRVFPGREDLLDLGTKCPVQIAAVGRVLYEFTRRNPSFELVPGQEVVVPSILLTGPRRPSGGRYGVSNIRAGRQQLPRDTRLAASRWRREHDQQRPHSRFSSCSRNFSSSPFMPITRWAMSASLALAPIVLTSRPSSWARNPSCLPTGRSAVRASRAA